MGLIRKMADADYQLLNDAYYGEGGFSDGTYITMHKRESKEKYDERRELSYYLNYIQPVVDSHVNAVFSSEPSREYTDSNGLYEAFIKDCDANGNSLNRCMKSTSLKAKLKATSLIVIDNFNRIPDDVESTIENRILPYMFNVDISRVLSDECELDDKKRIIKIVYQEDDYIDPMNVTHKMKREWDSEATRLFQQVSVAGAKSQWILTEETYHNLGILPCFFQYGTENTDASIIPTSQFLHCAKVNKALFNISSEERELQRKQAFNILIMPGDAPEGGLTVGTENVLYFPVDSTNTPSFIAPDGPLTLLANSKKDLVVEIYRMACVTYTQQYATQQSGESKRWTFHVTRQVLEDFAVNCEVAEQKIAQILGRWINHDLQAVITYSRKYGADDIDADIERTDIVLKMDLTDKVKAEAQKKFIRSYFASDDDSLIKSLEDDIDEQLLEKEADDTMGNDNADMEEESMMNNSMNEGMDQNGMRQ